MNQPPVPAVKDQLQEIFRTIFDRETLEIHDQLTAKDVEEWDSLNHIHLMVAIEKGFGIKFTTREISGLKNVGELIRLVAEKTTR